MCGTVDKDKTTYYDGDEMINNGDSLRPGHDEARATAANLILIVLLSGKEWRGTARRPMSLLQREGIVLN